LTVIFQILPTDFPTFRVHRRWKWVVR